MFLSRCLRVLAAATLLVGFVVPGVEAAPSVQSAPRPANANGGVSTDRLVVLYRAAASTRDFTRTSIRQRVGAQLLRSERAGSREVLRAPAGNAAAVAAQLKQLPQVLDAYPDRVVSTDLAANDPQFAQQWGVTKINAPTAWDSSEGAGARVAVLDCGIHKDHPDLAGQVVIEQDFSGSGSTDDLCNHGTHVAGTIAALTNNGVGVAGVAPGAQLLNGKVLDDSGSGYLSDVASGIEWAADNGANVISMSLGADAACDTGLQQAVTYAWNKGAVMVAAAGNSAASGAEEPGNCQNVIAVAATDQNDARASWSNYGSNVALAAPGVSIDSTVNPNDNNGAQYAMYSGTSMATPHVAGVAALIWKTSYGTSNAAVRDRLFSTADQIGGTGSLWTYGRVDAAAAVASPIVPVGSGPLRALSQPQRLVDTRNTGGPIAAGTTRCFTLAGHSGIPSDAAGVVLNVTTAGYSAPGWVTIYPYGQTPPTTSTLNFDPAVYAVANGTTVALGSGQVCASVGTINSVPGGSQLILDVTAYIPSSASTALPLLSSPQRLADTRSSGGAIVTGAARCFTVAGAGGIPSDAGAVLLNLTAAGYGARGWLTAYAAGQPVPTASVLNFDPDVYAVANGTLVRVGANGQVCVQVGTVNAAAGGAQVILDATGYVTSSALGAVSMLSTPQRLLDTRTLGGAIASGETRCYSVAGQAGVPSNAVGAVVNVTAVGYTTDGWVSVYPAGQQPPSTSTVNFDPAEYAVANTSVTPIGANGQLCVSVGTLNNAPGSAHVVLDVSGYVAP